MFRGKDEPWTELSRGPDILINRIVVDAEGGLFVADTWNSASSSTARSSQPPNGSR